jgi:nucleoid-associated protein YgaU
MRRIGFFILVTGILLGCAGKPAPDVTDGSKGVISERDSLKLGIENLKKGLEEQDQGDKEAARQAFMQASRHFGQVDRESREIMHRAISEMKKIVDISAFEYAPKDAFEVLLTYLKMQNAYMDGDLQVLSVLEKQLDEGIQKAQETTVHAKQKKMEELSQDVAQKRDEIKKQVQTDVLEIYPTIYVVKKNETLPSIASRHEIYNDSFMWPLIYKANRDQIKDPKAVYVGQDLKIPRDINIEEIIEARREAGAPDPEKIPKEAYTPRRK